MAVLDDVSIYFSGGDDMFIFEVSVKGSAVFLKVVLLEIDLLPLCLHTNNTYIFSYCYFVSRIRILSKL